MYILITTLALRGLDFLNAALRFAENLRTKFFNASLKFWSNDQDKKPLRNFLILVKKKSEE